MWTSLRLAALCLLFTNTFRFAHSLPVQKVPECNGRAELCDRKYGNTTFLGAHDSFAISLDTWALGRNQEITVQEQLQLGVRMLQVQAHIKSDGLHFCHTSCLIFDGGLISDYLTWVKTFLDQNPGEVITIIISNPERIPIKAFESVFDRTGMASLAYTPPHLPMKRDDWPTLGEMAFSGKRVVVFIDKGFEDETSALPTPPATPSGAEVPAQAPVSSSPMPEKAPSSFIVPQFQSMWEDPYDPDSSEFPCSVDRAQGPLEPSQQLNLVNHNLNINLFSIIGHGVRIPNRGTADVTNRASSIIEHAGNCAQFVNGNNPNFVLLDWVNIGQGVRAVNMLNGFIDD